MTKKLLLALLAAWPALGMSGFACLNTGCASTLSLGDAAYVVHSLDYKTVGADEEGNDIKRPLWRFDIKTSRMTANADWDGMAIVKKGIEDVGEIVGTLVKTVSGWFPGLGGG